MIEIERAEGRWTVIINRPDKANSLTRDMLSGLADLAEEAARENVAAFVLTGRGKVFSAGADLDEARAGLATDPVWERLSGAIAALPGLSIAALNGTLAGGAFGMALACDLRLAVPGARFFYPVMKLGFLPQPSDPGRLAALVGPARAKLLLMGGAKITADEAYAFGLVDLVVPGEEMETTIDALVADAIAAPPQIRAGIKALCNGRPA
ncbi:enoyl-CoA hydratase/isomerase family protein [Rhodovulum adriaticum]|uniref:Enoyl-CoA hydratase/carnithine racemase n=1 Tax=Rhodovulum adriaticum TaxID=35804 RepID=A0A4R2P005_RHOAD|nr:enoyl-CoA hydratase/isomerase family protein [Rhodovulum adriaticum]MBK1634243.1 enoyl-CoA hydratase [Rhodovulum adriaticum]TCP27204.1 enoyl-CoA hydratase/carnithine racemase [Rhodovulum adriaticum]